MKTKLLPESFLSKMSVTERQAIGQKTAQEACETYDRNLEGKLQKLIRNELLRREITFSYSPMHRKTTVTKNWPDFTFPLSGRFTFIEAKAPGKSPSLDQKRMHDALMSNGAIGIVTSDFAEVTKFLNEHGV